MLSPSIGETFFPRFQPSAVARTSVKKYGLLFWWFSVVVRRAPEASYWLTPPWKSTVSPPTSSDIMLNSSRYLIPRSIGISALSSIVAVAAVSSKRRERFLASYFTFAPPSVPLTFCHFDASFQLMLSPTADPLSTVPSPQNLPNLQQIMSLPSSSFQFSTPLVQFEFSATQVPNSNLE